MRIAIQGALAFALASGVSSAAPQQKTPATPEQKTTVPAPTSEVEEVSIAELQARLAAGKTTSERLVGAYLARIRSRDGALGSVLALNPDALAQARALDAERKAGRVRGPLHGIPIVVKDNVETADPMPTTAGSLALKENLTKRDAPFVARLRAAGAIVLGKTNLSEWANIRSTRSTSGWSAVGGLTRNPYAYDRNACGSSSGTGSAVAASFAAAGIGTETDGSITCPGAINGLVGLKPTVGLVSRTYVVPISHSQDTAGPMTRTVADAAALLTAMAGSDPADRATAEADAKKQDYTRALDAASLSGKRIGVMRFHTGYDPSLDAVFEKALGELKAAGAELVEIKELDQKDVEKDELLVLLTELKAGMNAYLAAAPAAVKTRSLADVIAFDDANAADEMPFFGQELFLKAEATKGLDDPEYKKARESSLQKTGPDGLGKLIREQRLDALVAPTTGPAWTTDLVNGDHYGGSSTTPAAVAGYPHLTVPMGFVKGLPVGLSFVGAPWSEARLLSYGYAFEKRGNHRRPPKYALSSEALPEISGNVKKR